MRPNQQIHCWWQRPEMIVWRIATGRQPPVYTRWWCWRSNATLRSVSTPQRRRTRTPSTRRCRPTRSSASPPSPETKSRSRGRRRQPRRPPPTSSSACRWTRYVISGRIAPRMRIATAIGALRRRRTPASVSPKSAEADDVVARIGVEPSRPRHQTPQEQGLTSTTVQCTLALEGTPTTPTGNFTAKQSQKQSFHGLHFSALLDLRIS